VPFRRLLLLLLTVTAGLSLAGCDLGDTPLGALGGHPHAPNAADAAFLRSMTQHETGSLGITQLARRRALRAELRGIARTMSDEQQDELHKLGSLAHVLGTRARRPPATSRAPSSALADLTRVKDATSFDYEFMRTMIEQNQAAIAIADDESRHGNDPETKRLAVVVARSRIDELEQIRAWLRQWYGGGVQPSPPAPGPPGGGGGHTPSPGPGSPHRPPGQSL
jgi:uncharacterized protein (DUF305 family)